MEEEKSGLMDWNALCRRAFLSSSANGIGLVALASLIGRDLGATPGLLHIPGLPPKAKRIIYLFQSGGPSQMDLFDPKPQLERLRGQELPPSIRGNQRITTMTSGQDSLPVIPTDFKFKKCGVSGLEMSELMPGLGEIADELCVIRSMHTDAINHDPAITLFQTGFQLAGRPSIGSWVSYGLGAINENLPSYVALTSRGPSSDAQPLYSRLWSSGFLPTEHSGVKFRHSGDPVYFLSNPQGINPSIRRDMMNDLGKLNKLNHNQIGDPEILSRMAQYELAFRMQSSIPELAAVDNEPDSILEMYGPNVRKPGSYARNCLLARRLAERDVRFIQLFHMGWDHHANLNDRLKGQCADTDRPTAGLIQDLKQRGLLDDTLIIWGGEFGRTIYAQSPGKRAGRDHHPRCFTTILAGAGVRGGMTYGQTDDFCYNIESDPVYVHDLNATILHLLGMNHEKLTFKYQGRQYRLTDIHGDIVQGILT